ncbi:MAG: HD domain-containing protein [Bacilli bacterium]
MEEKEQKSLDDIIEFILQDEEYLDYMRKIQKITLEFAESSEANGSIAFNHDLDHAVFVAERTKKLLKDLKSDEKTCKLGYIAGLLHDIGMINGKKGHADAGFLLAESYLNKFNLSYGDKCVILSAIKNHGGDSEINTTIDACIVVADKSHFDRDRVIKSKYSSHSKLNYIISNDVLIKGNRLILRYEVDDEFDKSIFYIIPKSIDTIVETSKKLRLIPIFYINEKEENFSDRNCYSGHVYG